MECALLGDPVEMQFHTIRRRAGLGGALCWLALVTCSGSAAADGKTYYVSPSGSGVSTNSASPGSASATLARLCNGGGDEINGGDTVLFQDGSYGTVVIDEKTCGAVGKHIVLRAATPLGARIENKSGFVVHGSAYYTIEGFEVSGSNSAQNPYEYGVVIDNRGATGKLSHHVFVRGNKLHDLGSTGVSTLDATHVVIEDNEIFATAAWDPYQNSGISTFQSRNPNGYAPLEGAYSNIIRNNRVYGVKNVVPHPKNGITDGNCIILDVNNIYGDYTARTLVANNLCMDNARGIWILTSSHVDVFNNTLYQNGNTKWGDGSKGPELGVYCESRGRRAHDIHFANNLVVPLSGARSISQVKSPSGCDDMSDITYVDNIFVDDLSSSRLDGNPSVPTSMDATQLGACTTNLIGANADSLSFASVGTGANADFALGSSSLAIDRGCQAPTEVETLGDFVGAPRVSGAGIDVGALEFQASAGSSGGGAGGGGAAGGSGGGAAGGASGTAAGGAGSGSAGISGDSGAGTTPDSGDAGSCECGVARRDGTFPWALSLLGLALMRRLRHSRRRR